MSEEIWKIALPLIGLTMLSFGLNRITNDPIAAFLISLGIFWIVINGANLE